MFPLRKLAELPFPTRLRKSVRILQAAEQDLTSGRTAPANDLFALLDWLGAEPGLPPELRSDLRAWLEEAAGGGEPQALPRALNRARHALLRFLGTEPAEWDLLLPGSEELDRSARRVFPIRVYLEELRSPFNVGAIFRTSEAFGVERILLSPGTPLPTHPRARKTARATVGSLPWETAGLSRLADDPAVFALELGGRPIEEFDFPASGTVLVGSEELGLSPQALRLADRSAGRVTIPLAGAKRSLNVAVAFGILIEHWFSRLRRIEANRAPGGE
jgi:TrmH family RNA methyltransferase